MLDERARAASTDIPCAPLGKEEEVQKEENAMNCIKQASLGIFNITN